MDVNIKQVNPFSLPSVSIYDLSSLPDTSGIYFALSETSKILYVGKANNFYQRWRTHHRLKEIKAHADVRVAWLQYLTLDENELYEIEKACIEHFKPLLNPISQGRVRVTAYLSEENNAWVREYALKEQLRLKRRVEISDVVNEAVEMLRRLK